MVGGNVLVALCSWRFCILTDSPTDTMTDIGLTY